MSWRSRKVRLGIGAILLMVAAAVCGLTLLAGQDQDSDSPKELSVASLKAQTAGPGKLWQTMRNTFNNNDLTEEQRRQARRNMREVFQSVLAERVDEYFAAAPEDKNAVLDRHIDDMQERMQRWREMREQRQREREEDGEESNAEEDHRQRWRDRWASQTTEQRKARSESRNPDQTARRMTYFSAMRKRMAERGIQSPGRWGGGRRGGSAGGHG